MASKVLDLLDLRQGGHSERGDGGIIVTRVDDPKVSIERQTRKFVRNTSGVSRGRQKGGRADTWGGAGGGTTSGRRDALSCP